MKVQKDVTQFLHQYEMLAMTSVRRPVRVLIADEIGLGKTITAISIAKYLNKIAGARRVLIIVPRILLIQWVAELNGMGISEVNDIERTSISRMRTMGFPPGYYIGSIDLLKRDSYSDLLTQVKWDLVIIDEAHKLSIKGSKRTIRYNEIGGKLVGSRLDTHAIFLSATPHKGDPEDYISRLKLLDPMLGSPKELDNRTFYRLTHEVLVFRRTKEDINTIYEGREVFKPATFYAVALPATNKEREFSEHLLDFMRTKLLEFADRGLLMNTRAIPLMRALLFKRASSSPRAAMLTLYHMFTKRSVEAALDDELLDEVEDIFEAGYEDYEFEEKKDPDQILDQFIDAVSELLSERDKEEIRTLYGLASSIIQEGDTKVWALIQLLDDFMKRGNEKIIIFTEYRDTLEYIKTKVLEQHPEWKDDLLTLTAVESGDKELFKKVRSRFEKDPNCRVLLATDVAAEGLNLQVANLLLNYEVPWSTVKLEQRIGRVWRLGQERSVGIYTLFLGNRSDLDALNILYQKLLNMRRAQIGARPLMGQEVIVYAAGAQEVGKVPMAVTETGKRFKKITERTLIDAYIKGGGAELTAIVRSIIAAKLALQDEIQSKSVFYTAERRARLEERLGLLGFRNISELQSSVLALFRSVSGYYSYTVTAFDGNSIKVQQRIGMPISISKVTEALEMLSHEDPGKSPVPFLVSYGPEERTILVCSVQVRGKKDLILFREPVGLSGDGKLYLGRNLLELVANSIDNLIGSTESSHQDIPRFDNLLVVKAPNAAQDSARRLLTPLEEYLNTLIKEGLRNARVEAVKQEDVDATISAEPLGVLNFVKRPAQLLEAIPYDVRQEAERKAVEIVMAKEREEGRIPREIPFAEQVDKHYDILSTDPNSKEERMIEVKGHMGPEVYGELTDDEGDVAQKEGEKYWLCIVYNIRAGFKLLRFPDPFNSMNYEIIEKVTKEKRYVLWPKAIQT
jgi:SNF2 family DNA or RNA helicase